MWSDVNAIVVRLERMVLDRMAAAHAIVTVLDRKTTIVIFSLVSVNVIPTHTDASATSVSLAFGQETSQTVNLVIVMAIHQVATRLRVNVCNVKTLRLDSTAIVVLRATTVIQCWAVKLDVVHVVVLTLALRDIRLQMNVR